MVAEWPPAAEGVERICPLHTPKAIVGGGPRRCWRMAAFSTLADPLNALGPARCRHPFALRLT